MAKVGKKQPMKISALKKSKKGATGNTLESLHLIVQDNDKRGIENERAIAKDMLRTMDARLEEMAKLPSSDLLNEFLTTTNRTHGHFYTTELRGAWERYLKRLRSIIIGRMNGADKLVKKVRVEPSVIIDRNLLQGMIKGLKLSPEKRSQALYKTVRKHFNDNGGYRRDET